MECLDLQSPPRDFVDPDLWASIEEAAVKLKKREDVLRRVCRDELSQNRNAVMAFPPDGGHAQWYIFRTVDARLRNARDLARHTYPLLMEYSERQRRTAWQRMWAVHKFRELRSLNRDTMIGIERRVITQANKEYPELKISRSTLYAWEARFQWPCELANLVDHRGGDQRHEGRFEAWEAFKQLFLSQSRPTVRQCWEEVKNIAAEKGWSWCGYDACCRNLNKFVPELDQVLARDPEKYRTAMEPFRAQDPESWRAGERWIGDHKQLDVICRWAKGLVRPWLTTWMDWRTRKVCGWVLSDQPNSTTILAALRHGLMEPSNKGGPAEVQIDNGKDYDAWMFHGQTKSQRRGKVDARLDEAGAQGIFFMLGIKAHFANPYGPNGKARLERWFRTLESFFKTFATYTGDGIDTKPERLNEILATPRLIPTFDEVRQRIDDHIAGYNRIAEHAKDDLSEGGETISPNEAYARWCDTERVLADPKALDLCLQHWHRPVTVGRNGIAITINGKAWHYGQYEQILKPFKALRKADRRLVRVYYDPRDLSKIQVHDEKYRFLCTAAMNDIGGLPGRISKEHLKTQARNAAIYNRAEKQVGEHGLTRILTKEEQVAAIAAGDNHAAPESPAMKLVGTPLDGQAREIARQELKVAVGAEDMSPPVNQLEAFREKLGKNLRAQRQSQRDEFAFNPDPLKKWREMNVR